MATQIAVPAPVAPVAAPEAPPLTLQREWAGWQWLATVDHKKIGILYLLTGFAFFLLGGFEALLMRTQLIRPLNTFLHPDVFNQMFTMHATTMIFLAIMPMGVGLGNFIVPLMVGAGDMAYPRLNAFSYWLFLFGGIFINMSFLMGGAPNTGWFSYAPLTEKQFSATNGVDFWLLGLQLLGIASIAGAVNFIVTILKLRAPGLTFMRLPLFAWMTLIVSFLIVFAFPSITIALILLMFDRLMGTAFFLPGGGGDPLLWQHLFWFFGHPEVYILVLPAMGVTSDVLSTFSRKPIFGYRAMAFSMIAIAFLSWIVYGHHMFISGMNPALGTSFMLTTMVIAVPSAIKSFNWLGTVWGGSIRFRTPMLHALGFFMTFVIGGLSGIFMANTPVDIFIHDTYFIVAHFHYVVAGIIFAMFAAITYWFPKIFGRMMNEPLGKIHFVLTFVFFNLVFFPMHFLGVGGMMRRIYNPLQYDFLQWTHPWNVVISLCAFGLGLAQIPFIINFFWSLFRGPKAPLNPWEANTLEWTAPSPPPHLNWGATLPVVYRGPYEYSSPEVPEDYLPQSRRLATAGAAARSH
jgi:cytochrome c oxidase subunit 1